MLEVYNSDAAKRFRQILLGELMTTSMRKIVRGWLTTWWINTW